MEEAEIQGGGGAPETEREAVKEEGDPGRAGEETRAAEEGRGGALQARGGREESHGGGVEEEEAGAGRVEASGYDAGPEGEAKRRGRRRWGRQTCGDRGEFVISGSDHLRTMLIVFCFFYVELYFPSFPLGPQTSDI